MQITTTHWAVARGFVDPLLPESPPPTYAPTLSDAGLLLVTIGFEVSGTLLLKRAATGDWVAVLPAYLLYFSGITLFTIVLRRMPLAIAYATWCALGTIGVTLGSVVAFGEALSLGKAACIAGTMPLVAGLYLMR